MMRGGVTLGGVTLLRPALKGGAHLAGIHQPLAAGGSVDRHVSVRKRLRLLEEMTRYPATFLR